MVAATQAAEGDGMIGRRRFLGTGAMAATALLAPGEALAWLQERRFGSPAGTSPFPPEVYRERRQRLMTQMKGGVAVVYGAEAVDQTPQIDGQNRDFSYLTGIQDEAGAALVLAPAERTYREFLFLAPRNPEVERYEGIRLGLTQNLRDRTGFEQVRRMNRLGRTIVDLASRSGELHYLGPLADPEAPVPPALELYGQVAARVPGTRIVNSHNLIRQMRLVKEPRELELIRQAIAATERGLRAGIRAARPGMREFELKAIIEAEFRAAGARGLAFPSIVGTGPNSAILHYTGGDAAIRPGDVVLCDVGASVGGYTADITRTFPVDGRFTAEQRRVYDIVFDAQETALRNLRAGAVHEDVQNSAREVIRAAGHIDDFWHGLGHFVGLEVHDVGNYAGPLPAGAVITIEPGIYLPERGFGIRIEDDYLVTPRGYDHLSAGVPRAAEAVEALRRAG
jgi:Xaa-Pro aminopeptidase